MNAKNAQIESTESSTADTKRSGANHEERRTRDAALLRACRAIHDARNVLCINPTMADSDSIGSSLALASHRTFHHKPCVVSCPREHHVAFRYLPGSRLLRDPSRLFPSRFDCLVALDFPDPSLSTVVVEEKRNRGCTLINIDHHLGNASYGDVNCVEPRAAATAEILFRLFRIGGWRIDANIATCLLAGIVSDTGSFSFRNTTNETLAIAADCLRRGARLSLVIDHGSRTKTVRDLRLWGVALTRLSIDAHSEFAMTFITQKDCANAHVDDTAAEGIANLLNLLGEGKGVLVLRELSDGTVKGSIRTMRDDIDVSRLAEHFGGGGHRRAAGFVVKKPLENVLAAWKNLDKTHASE
jgi:phosphoesterase RecJ-like protein